jgi:hypothetical protein
MHLRHAILWLCASACVLGCGGTTAPLSYSNGTTIAIELLVNGSNVLTVQPGAGGELSPAQLPSQPWRVTAATSSGRVLLSMLVQPGDVQYGPNSARGDGVRLDLSCGRLDLWSGPPLLGPARPPSPGSPGDCNP